MGKRLLILAQNYPDPDGGKAQMFIHMRNMNYLVHGFSVTVLNFQAKYDYVLDGVSVITEKSYRADGDTYDFLLLHAANLKNHLRFLVRYGSRFPQYVFFYHGHEVLWINHDYPAPYSYMRRGVVRNAMQELYDRVKLFSWRSYLPKIAKKSHFVFVSQWIYDKFLENVRLAPDLLYGRSSIIYNCVGNVFERASYDCLSPKQYDFITVRSNLDGSKYAIDIVNRIANNSPNSKFLIVGRGKIFENIPMAGNIEWLNKALSHEELISVLSKARYALMPTRADTQGVMACEMAAFGMPLITSDISVCHEIFDGFSNVRFIDNEDEGLSLDGYREEESICVKDDRYYKDKTAGKELELLEKLTKWRRLAEGEI